MKFKMENMAKTQFSYIPTVLVLIFVSVFPLINCNPPPKVFKDAPSLTIEGHVYPSSVKPPESTKNFFLGGAGVRGLEFKGKFVKFTTIGIYLEETAIRSLSKWKAQIVEELANSKAFFYDIITGPFEKFTMITMIRPLTGKEYSTKVIQNFIAVWKADKKYGKEEEKATKQFLEIFKNESLPPGTSILFTQTPQGVLKIAFSKDGSIPAKDNAEIANKELSEAILYSIIGEHGVSPALKRNVAERMTKVLKTELKVQGNNESKTQKQGKGSDSSSQQNKH